MQEIMMPVKLLNNRCLTCEYINIDSNGVQKVYTGEGLVSQQIDIHCMHLSQCEYLKRKWEQERYGK